MKKPPDRRGYETRDWDFWTVTKIGSGIVAVVILSHFAVGLVLHHYMTKPGNPGASLEREASLPPEPRLQINPAEDLKAMRRDEEAILNSSGRVDRVQGIVRIPIERAIDLTVQRGLPARIRTSQNQGDTTR
jgi:hypothetical protein